MAIQTYKPTTPSRRGMTTADKSEITTKLSKKTLLVSKKRISGRNAQGKITIRHRGGGAKRFYRLVDFKLLDGTKATIKTIEYDPNRSANIALIETENNKLAYILAGSGMKVGRKISVGKDAEIKKGNRLPIKAIPVGSLIYNIELHPGGGGKVARGAGTKAQLMAKEDKYCQIKLPSGEIRLFLQECMATLGSVGNEAHQNIKYGNAGRRRHMGWRPTVRGKAMNPVDHPHGGGEGGNDIGLPSPMTPWGKPALGLRTRKRKIKNKLIIRRRKNERGSSR